jgi:ribonuclease E
MRKEKHRRGVERALRDAVRRDRARTKILRTSPFGLIEMTRQRVRPSLKLSVFRDCPCCDGRAVVKSAESMAIEVVRLLILASQQNKVARVTVTVHDEVATYLNNKKRRELASIEEEGEMTVQILGREGLYPEHLEIECRDADGHVIEVQQ